MIELENFQSSSSDIGSGIYHTGFSALKVGVPVIQARIEESYEIR